MQDKRLTLHETRRLVEHAINYVSQQELALLLGVPASRISEAKNGKYRLTHAELEKVEHDFGPVVTEKGDWLIAESLTDDMNLAIYIKNMIKAFESLAYMLVLCYFCASTDKRFRGCLYRATA